MLLKTQPKLHVIFSCLLCIMQGSLYAQSSDSKLNSLAPVTDAMLANPPAADWLMWRRTYDAYGFSPLDQINKSNVSGLQQAYSVTLDSGANMATPLVHDGVMFLLSTRDTVLALDATTGEQLWSYRHENNAPPATKIGLALYNDMVLVPTSDLHILALSAKTGAVVWDHAIDAQSTGPLPYSLRSSPLIANGQVIQGVTATLVPEGGFIIAVDLATGKESWRFHTVARPESQAGNSWNELELDKRSGGSVWVPGSYDPELELVYFGSGPTYDTKPLLPELNKTGVTNDALYTNTTVALRPATGELVWHYQHMANDQWDLDWAYERQIISLQVAGVVRKVVLTAGKMALFDAVDAATGAYVFSFDMGIQNIVAAIDPVTGHKTLNPNAVPSSETAQLVCPFALGGRNWQSTSYNPLTKSLFVPLSEVCMMGGPTGGNSILTSGAPMNPVPRPIDDGFYGRTQAVNLETQVLTWNHKETMPATSGSLATAGGLVFNGTLDNQLMALDDTSGEVLWQVDTGDTPASFPISYAVNGKQYVALVVGQAAIHAGTYMAIIGAFTGGAQSPLAQLPHTGPALVVYALP
ncbi:MAG: alcohol dehydrogenase [Gammaproteobacteria bacterium]|nr:alcohol dehydrogenase [Gammaproteobacteria bacterium]